MEHSTVRERLIRAGEELFARDGLDRVRLRELNTRAGVRNDSAVHYYFGSREGLFEAIMQRHLDDISVGVQDCVDTLCPGESPAAVRDAIAALAIPFAEKLNDYRGRMFIVIMARMFGDGGYWREAQFVPASGVAMEAIRRNLTSLPENIREERMRLIIRFVVLSFAARAHRVAGEQEDVSLDAFLYDVVEMAAAAYDAKVPVGEFWPSHWPRVADADESR